MLILLSLVCEIYTSSNVLPTASSTLRFPRNVWIPRISFNLLQRYGVWAEWDHPYLTLDPEYEAAQVLVIRSLKFVIMRFLYSWFFVIEGYNWSEWHAWFPWLGLCPCSVFICTWCLLLRREILFISFCFSKLDWSIWPNGIARVHL